MSTKDNKKGTPAETVKTKEQVIAEILVKSLLTGVGSLSADEKKLLAENSSTIANLSKSVTSAKASIDAEQLAKEKEKYQHDLLTFITDFKARFEAILLKTPEVTGTDVKSFLKEQAGLVPVWKTKGSGSGTSTPIGPKTGNIRPDSYAGVIKAALMAAGEKGLTFAQLGEAIVKAKPETAKMNAVGTNPLWVVYAQRTKDWFPNVVRTGKTVSESTFVWK